MHKPDQIVTTESVAHLPDFWDEVAGDNVFLRRQSLMLLQKVNLCSQRYHYHESGEIIMVSYKLKVDLLSFLPGFSLKATTRIIGIPLSVSQAGYAVTTPDALDIMARFVRTLPGLTIILNSEHTIPLSRGRTLSSFVLPLPWANETLYWRALRSSYKRSHARVIRKLGPVRVSSLKSNDEFTPQLYDLYLSVYHNSTKKLEKLDISFFKEYPAKIYVFYQEERAVGFVQLTHSSKQLYFLLGGFECRAPAAPYLYAFMLHTIVSFGIQQGFECIDLGQTAEESKSRTGAKAVDKWMYVHHCNPIANWIIANTIGLFSYKPYTVQHRVFKHE